MKTQTSLAVAAVLILAGQAGVSNFFQRDPYLPAPPPLSIFPITMDRWQVLQDSPIEAEVLNMLGPDDTLSREYQLAGSGTRAGVFVAYYKTQLRAKNAHDPKVCLPGSGWNPLDNRVDRIPLQGGVTLPVNYYRIARGDASAVVLYWFQTHTSVQTKEQELRFRRLIDAVQENRTDMALVRIVVPVDSAGLAKANERAYDLARLVYPRMLEYFPATGS